MKNSNGSNYSIAVTLDRTINESDKYITVLSVVVF